jgi:hypothetical protein
VRDEPRCFVRTKLAQAVADAVVLMSHAKRDHERAEAKRENLGPSLIALAVAREIERKALEALEAHKKEHGCG